MSMREVWICDCCGMEQREDRDDGPPADWAQNIENDDFCPKCSSLLDPPEEDEEWSPDTAQELLERGPR